MMDGKNCNEYTERERERERENMKERKKNGKGNRREEGK